MSRRLLLAVALLTACAGHPPAAPAGWSGADVVLLGEVHDNAEAHARRLTLLQEALAAGWRPALVMEQFDREHQMALTAGQRDCGEDIDCLIRAGAGAVDGGWHWAYYRPLLALAQRYRLPLVAANLSRADALRVMRGDMSVLTAHQRQRLERVPADLRNAQAQAVAEGHCHLLPERLLPGMARAQIARDLVMTDALSAHREHGAVLLAGNGHVRRDLGVPRWLPESLGVGFLERPRDPADGRYDQVVLVPAASRGDPCESLSPAPASHPPAP